MTQVYRIGPMVGGRLALFCIHRVNSRNDFLCIFIAKNYLWPKTGDRGLN